MNLLYQYQNGNAVIKLYDNGTRIISTEDDEFIFDVPCNMDIKITNFCTMGCPMCHENSTPQGKHAPLSNFKFLENWGAGKECAFGGGMVTSYPHLEELLKYTKDCGLVANATFHQKEFIDNFEMIKKFQEEGLLNGIGISFSQESDDLVRLVPQVKNVVFHVIAGLFTKEQRNYLRDNFKNPKLLILGYKHFRRGNDLYDKVGDIIEEKIAELNHDFDNWSKEFYVISFDNLAIEQLKMKDKLDSKTWDKFYQGEEGLSNMYVDAVEGKFARNSTAINRYDLIENVKEMFGVIKNETNL